MNRRTFALVILATAALFATASVRAQLRYETLEFPTLLRAHAAANIGLEHMPTVGFGDELFAPAVYVTANQARILIYGKAVVSLDRGRVPDKAIARCASGAACIPSLRRAIATARAELARELGKLPQVILLVDRRVPYGTLLLMARSSAEAGAPLSTVIAAMRGPEIVGLPVWVAPGRTLLLSSATDPSLITVEINGGVAAVRTASDIMSRPHLARGLGDLLDVLGQLELTTGRTTYFVAGSPLTPSGEIITTIAAVRDIFPHAVLSGMGERRAVIR